MKVHNPIIRGFYPDPSICKANGTYYLACSSLSIRKVLIRLFCLMETRFILQGITKISGETSAIASSRKQLTRFIKNVTMRL